jgi:hypothetical protein
VTKYYYRVRAFNASLFSPYSAVSTTSTWGDPTIPALSNNPSPADAGTYGVANPLKLTWSNPTTPYGGSIRYFVYLGTNKDSLQLIADSITTTSFTSGTLPVGRTYYWRVDARNSMGRTTGSIWSFETVLGGQLFTTNFYSVPSAFFTSYGTLGATTNIVFSANASKTVGGMTFGCGATAIRIAYIPQGNPSSLTSDYGPYTVADTGSTFGCVQFVTESSGGWAKFPEVQGPCTFTLWAGNTSAASRTFYLNTIVNGVESRVSTFTMAAAKRAFKFQYTYLGTDKVTFKVDANGKKINMNDILIESFVPIVSESPIAITSSPDTTNVNYMDGSMILNFNQTIRCNGGVLINGDQYEQVSATGGGTAVQINYVGLDASTDYTIQFPDNAITDFYNTKNFNGEFNFHTSDFLPSKVSGETHFGKAATILPLSFKPFNVVAPFVTVGGLVQTAAADFPHWITSSGGISSDSVLLTSTSDKMMGYFNDKSKILRVKANMIGSGTVTLKVQECRNPDGTPGWRTIRQLTNANLPMDMEFYLNPESRFVKVVPVSISGSLVVKEMQVSNAEGHLPTSISGTSTDLGVRVLSSNGGLRFINLSQGMHVVLYDATGRLIAKKTCNDRTLDLELRRGFYVVTVQEGSNAQKIKAFVF